MRRLQKKITTLLSRKELPESAKDDMYKDYRRWLQFNTPDYMSMHEALAAQEKLAFRPLISVILPVDLSKGVQKLDESVRSVLGQLYSNWELIIVAEGVLHKTTKKQIKDYEKQDVRVRIFMSDRKFEQYKVRVVGVEKANGEYVAVLESGDMLYPNALYEVALLCNKERDVEVIYTDEDQIPDDRYDKAAPFFKPDWSPELLKSIDYISHLGVYKKKLIEDIGGWRDGYGFASDWDLAFRATDRATKICHIPKVLYSRYLENHLQATEDKANQKKAIEDNIKEDRPHRLSVMNEQWSLSYVVDKEPPVSIVIPTKNNFYAIKKCLSSIFQETKYKNYEIILVDTGSTSAFVKKYYTLLERSRKNVRVIYHIEDQFSYAKSCNFGASRASGEVLVMLNNDTEIISGDWLTVLAAESQIDDVGAVGAQLLYPKDGRIQHAGVGVGLGGFAANLFSGVKGTDSLTRTQYLMTFSRRDVAAVTGACMAIKKSVFDGIGGFDEKFRITYNDVDLCLRLIKKGYRNVYLPQVVLKHYESLSLGLPELSEGREMKEFTAAQKLFRSRWGSYIKHDPYLNDNIDKTNSHFMLNTSKRTY